MFPSFSNSPWKSHGWNDDNNNNNNNSNNNSNAEKPYINLHNMKSSPLQDVLQKRLKTATPQPRAPDHWSRKSDLDLTMDQSNSPARSGTPYFGYDLQLLSDDPFSPGDFLRDDSFDAYTSTKQSALDPSLWAAPSGLTPRFGDSSTSVNLDYFALDPEEAASSDTAVAPSELLAAASPPPSAPPPVRVPATRQSTRTINREPTPSSPTSPQELELEDEQSHSPSSKPTTKRGRKRKQLDSAAQVVERRKFLERNRVAANRCRERKKTYVASLEHRANDLNTRNNYLTDELRALNEEVSALRALAAVKCACDEEKLQRTLRERLNVSGMERGEVEEVVRSFTAYRGFGFDCDVGSGGVSVGMDMHMEMGMQAWEGRQTRSRGANSNSKSNSNSDSSASSVQDEVFSPPTAGLRNEHGSEQSSPMEIGEGEKLTYHTS